MKRLALGLLVCCSLTAKTAKLDGRKIFYETVGKGKQAVVMIHGWTCDHTFWSAQRATFSSKYRIVEIDLPGHGQSEPAPDYTMERMARAVNAVMRRERIPKATLMGHSMGGAVMLAFLRQFPDQVKSIVAVDAVIIDAAVAEKYKDMGRSFAGPEGQSAREKMVRGMFSSATSPELQKKILNGMLGPQEEVAVGAMTSTFSPAFWKEDRFETPLLAVIAPGPDSTVLEAGTKKRFPKAEVIVLPGTGHFLMMEKPEDFNRLVLEWLSR